MKEQWNARYNSTNYIYGIEPNSFFAESLLKLNPGKILLPGEGEGRNAIYAAQNLWEVHAFDYSNVACEKALRLANKNNVNINYSVHDTNQINFAENSFDLIAVFYLHLITHERIDFHNHLIKLLKPKGVFLAEYFSKEQLNNNSGGPRKSELLYSKSDIFNDFNRLSKVKIEEVKTYLDEGDWHKGQAEVIRIIGNK